MGRRKINIEPITHERNRTVTFIKRKAGLFKKAHELAVLCQVDVAVIILGHNNTFYEFSSVDTNDLIRHYQSDELVHDIKQPSDYGDYVKKERVVLRPNRKRNAASRNAAAAAAAAAAASGSTLGEVSSVGSPDSRPVKRQLRSKRSSSSLSTRSMSNGAHRDIGNDDDMDEDDEDDEDDDDEDDDNDNDNDNDDDEDDDVENDGNEILNDSIARDLDHDTSSALGSRRKSKKQSHKLNSAKHNENRTHTVRSPADLSTSNNNGIHHNGSDSRSIDSSMNMTSAHSASATSLNSMSARQSPFMDLKTSSLPKQQNSSGVELNTGLKFNPLQEHVQRQFHNLYNSKEPRIGTPVIQPQMVNSGFSRNNMTRLQDSSDMGSKLSVQSPMTALRTMLSGTKTPSPTDETSHNVSAQSKLLPPHHQQKRPVLRVEIPTNNTTVPIKSEVDSAISDGQPKSATDSQRTPSNVLSQPLSSSPVIGEKPRTSANSTSNTGFLYSELPSGFVASPSVPQYFATPLQAQNNATSMLQIQNPQNYLMQRQLQYAQQQHQMQQQRTQLNNPQQKNRSSVQVPTTSADHNSGPLTGSLPSKFAHDLIVQSPNTSIGGMFQEWPFPPNTSTVGRSNSTLPHLQMTHQQSGGSQPNQTSLPTGQRQAIGHSQQSQQQQQQQQQQHVISNGSPGLSPYINVNQTPTGRTFNFGDAGSTTYGSDKGSIDKRTND